MYKFKIQLKKEEEGGYLATVPALPGCITQGDDTEEAIEMAKETISLYLEELDERAAK